MTRQRHLDSSDRQVAATATELEQTASKLATFHRISWKEAFGTIASPAVRLHRYRNARGRLLQDALCNVEGRNDGGCGA